jgi:hypothetical protein
MMTLASLSSPARIRNLMLSAVTLMAAFAILSRQTVLAESGAGQSLRAADNGEAQKQGDLPTLNCSPAPCVLPNRIVTTDSVDSTIIVANPNKPRHLLAGAMDLSCGYVGAQGYGSKNGGSSWFKNCSTYGGNYDAVPTVAYGLDSTGYVAGVDGYDDSVLIESTQDDGQSWSKAVIAVAPVFSYGYALTPWLAIDNSKSSPYSGRLYIATTQRDHTEVQSETALSYSTDGGNTWSTFTVDKVQAEPTVDYYSRVAIAADGTVYVAWQRCEMLGRNVNCGGTTAQMLFSKSVDGGKTWSDPAEIARVRLAPDSCDCAFFGNLPNTNEPVANPPLLAVDDSTGPYAGTVYVAVYKWTGKQMKAEVTNSRDGGKSWGKPVEVAGLNRNDQFFPGLSVSSDGIVGLSWLDRRNDPQDVSYQPFAAISTDGGKSFGKNFRLARYLSNPYYSFGYMGDYTGNAWAGTTLYYTWPDTRNGIMQDYVGGLRVK